MKIAYDFFAGTGSATKSFRESDDWRVIQVELKERFNPDIQADILELEYEDLPEKNPDFVWASPPCPAFSLVATESGVGHRYFEKFDQWGGVPGESRSLFMPRKEKSVKSVRMVYHTLHLIQQLNPDYWFMENPRGLLRKVIGMPNGTVTYCQYGYDAMKPTDLWGAHPPSFKYKSCSPRSSCHQSSPRGSGDSGIQGMSGSEERSKIPEGLSLAVKEAVENPDSNGVSESLDGFV